MKHLLILGGGSAAVTAARLASERGMSITLVNEGLPLGGTCLHVGCVPSKVWIRAGESVRHAQHSRFDSIRPRGSDLDFAGLSRETHDLITNLREVNYEATLPDVPGLTLVHGRGRLVDGIRIQVEDQVYEGDAVLIATGSTSALPPIPGLAESAPLTNETLFHLPRLPASLVVLGGGYIALEAAQMMHRLGCRVTVLQRSAHLLSDQPAWLGEQLAGYLRDEGITVHCDTTVREVRTSDGGVDLLYEHGGQSCTVAAEKVFVGLGRRGNTADLNLEAAGVETHGNGFIRTNRFLQTACPTVWAAGDVLGGKMFVYTASHEAEVVVPNLLGDPPREPDYRNLPWVVFTDPQVAGTGLDADQARAQGYDVEEAELPVTRWPRFRVARETRGCLRLIRDRGSDTLLGARAICPEGGDLMTELRLIIRHRIPLRQVADDLYPYLTLSEGIQRCAAKFH